MDVSLQGVDLSGQVLDAVERHDANLCIFQRYSVTGVVVIHDTVEADYLPGHLKAGDLVSTIFRRDTGLEKPSANGVQAGELLTIAKQGASTLDLASAGDDVINPI
jgi:hypothetical protein